MSHLNYDIYKPENAFEYFDEVRRNDQEKTYNYYMGDTAELSEYLRQALLKMYDEDSIAGMLFTYLNIIRKIVNTLAVLYKSPVKRQVAIEGKVSKELSDLYNRLLPVDVEMRDLEAHRMAKLFNTALPHLTFDSHTGRFQQETMPSYLYKVNSRDNLKPDLVSYYRQFFIKDDWTPETFEVFHTDNEIYLNDSGKQIPLPNAKSIQNPYGAINFIPFRLQTGVDFWGISPINTAVVANEEINVLLTKLTRDDLVLGTSGILFGVNLASGLGIDVTSTTDRFDTSNTKTVKEIKSGRSAVVNVQTGMGDTIQPDLKYISTNPQAEQVMNVIREKIKMLALSYGINPNSFSTDIKVESGSARAVARQEEEAQRQEDIHACRMFERNRFNFIRTAIRNLKTKGYKGANELLLIPDNATIQVDFGETKEYTNTTDKWLDRRMNLRYGIKNAVDFLLEDNPDLSIEDAEKIVENNLSKYEDYRKRFDKLEDEITGKGMP